MNQKTKGHGQQRYDGDICRQRIEKRTEDVSATGHRQTDTLKKDTGFEDTDHRRQDEN